MKINQPVTQTEFVLPDGAMLVSKTDLKGVITYCNLEFIETSGFSERELLGAPHNLVRHPDMPPEAFDDLWNTLKAGKPWTGYVKNRRKNGDFYWVLANATPIWEGGKVAGYLSVRAKPSADAVREVAAVYRKFRAGQAGSLTIREGKVVNRLYSKFSLPQSIGMRLWLFNAIFLSIALLAMGWMLSGLSKTGSEFGQLVEVDYKILSAYENLYALGLQEGQATRNIILNPKDDKARSNLGAAENDFAVNLEALQHITGSDPIVIKRIAQMHESLRIENREAVALAALNQGAAVERMNSSGTKIWRALKKDLLEQVDAMRAQVAERKNEVDTDVGRTRNTGGILMAIATLLMVFMSYFFIRSIARPLKALTENTLSIAQGVYSSHINTERDDEIGHLSQALKSMQIRLGFEVAESQRTAAEILRIKVALDNVSTNVMIGDIDGHIIYLNKSVQEMFHKAEKDIRQALPHFEADKLLGANIDTFHKNPAHQRNMLAALASPYTTTILIGIRTFRLTANPVIDETGRRLGTALEWIDRTAEVVVEEEISRIVGAAAQGDFTQRIGTQDKEGFFLQLAQNINQLMDTSSVGLNEVVRVLSALAQGDLTQTISNDYSGTFGQLKDYSNTTVESLQRLIGEIKETVDQINTAAGEIASGNSDLSQRTEEQASSLEETASSMEELTSTVRNNADNAKQANQLAIGASNVAVKGGDVVGQVVETMSSINESSRKIVDIISVIDGIAFQTNILALNAAVEAARAGEQGRGFAVVAGEVRNLAQRSAAAAKEIKTLIGDSVDKVENGSKLVANAGQTMDEIVTSIKHVTDIMAEISSASTEQSAGIEQVNKAITQMDEATQQNAALVEEAAAAAESLEEQAHNLSVSVSVFKIDSGRMLKAPASAILHLPG
ncbi:hypothetical protein SKTS_24450 [Sulfurimicrobium lacus]|uniref:Methyl-accepting chemotaxis protein n=1 Tax=Sulfurimicrobium lacus TaxID=2715678 RepID=A0A6F8VFR1_9PROT|nr:methyl-accepting chemotaxis protein [Sulfurimicrobium lacus]BCB27559.1 hypothetical protein SKTS_24450 [Sulfurimicrobium lacus]